MLAQTIGIVVVLLLVLAAGLALTIRYVWGSVFGHTNSPTGTACSEDKNCANGTCARYGKGGPLQCCPVANGSEYYGPYEYCTSLPDGTPCWSGAMCASGLCDDTDTCAPLLSTGAACASGSQCESGYCYDDTCQPTAVQTGAACVSSDQCPSGSDCARPAYPGTDGSYVCCQGKSEVCDADDYCLASVPNGGQCGDNCNDICQSGNCVSGVCQPSGLPPQQACGEDSDCANGECGRAAYCPDDAPPGCTEPTICCPNGWELADGHYYCEGVVPNGGFCRRDGMCQSGYCYDGGCTESMARGLPVWEPEN